MYGENIGDQFGSTACAVDFNDDGYPDLLISAPASDNNKLSSGAVYIFYGGPDADTVADLTLVGAASSFFGQALASAGDFNGDGAEDLLVGAPFYDSPATSAGAVYLFYGGQDPDTVVDHIFTGEYEGDYFGTAVAGVGDINDDTYDDIAIGAYKADWGTFNDAGRVYLYYGGPSPDYVADMSLVGVADGERFGCALAGGDFNGDDHGDVAVGAYSYDSAFINQGRIYLFFGGGSLDSLADLTITGDSAGYKFGWRLSAGKVNADDNDDLVMSSDGVTIDTFDAGKVYLFDGGPGMDESPFYTYTLGRLQHDRLGDAVASGVDINGNGYDEILSGMPDNADNGTSAGGAVVIAGGSSADLDTTFLGGGSEEQMGKAVGFWPAYKNAFGIVFGATGYDNFRGRVYLFMGSQTGENQPPVLNPIGPRTGYTFAFLSFNISAYDPDGTIPGLSVPDLPDGALFDDNHNGTGTFDWTPLPDDTGEHHVTFVASDTEFADSELVVITIEDASTCCQGYTGNTNCDPEEKHNLADITCLIDRVYVSMEPLCCEPAGNTNGDVQGKLNLADITALIDHVYISHQQTAPCP
jgi:hypothetical protein